ncbi:MAG: ROK family protein [bacterium]|nr:ROK family protein [bacterium]
MKRIGIDIGGTKIQAGLVLGDKILKKIKAPTPASAKDGLLLIETLLNELTKKEEIAGIGIGVAGFIDIQKGEIISSPNLPFWNGFPLKKAMEERFKGAIFVDNDVNCATLAEARFGVGIGKKNIVGIFVGTGIGGGILIDDKLIHGATCSGVEIGHITINPKGPVCMCGRRGCLEAYSGGWAIMKYACYKAKNVDEVVRLSKEGDKKANLSLERAGKGLSLCLANLITTLSPDMVILGGGVIKAAPIIFEMVKTQVPLIALPVAMRDVQIEMAKFKEEAGFLGASLLG